VESEVPLAVYPAMLAGTMVGHFLGMGFDALVLGSHFVGVPLVCSLLLEALVGARYAAARMGHPLTSSERGRLSVYYSLALAGISVPLAVWLVAAHVSRDGSPAPSFSSGELALWGAAGLVGLAAYTAARYGLMGLFSPRRPA
jgi:hypothetical protein